MKPNRPSIRYCVIGVVLVMLEMTGLMHSHAAEVPDPRNHWAFVPPVRASLPENRDRRWVRNDLDRFVLGRLDKEGLKPAVEADRPTLLKRLSLDLVGLPPTLAELEEFLGDKSPDAYAKQVERLLRSPHYGERWGRLWLDAARYADSDGYEKDLPREIWPWRDYVLNALNRDLPYDQFVIEQIAGDELPDATQEQIVATGFLRNSMINEEGAVDAEQFRMDAMFDRMDCIGKTILGLTIQCAQCHSHKSDPLSQQDYYGMFAFLNNAYEAQRKVYSPAQASLIAQIRSEIHAIEDRIKTNTPDWKTRLLAWEESERARVRPVQWTVLQAVDAGVPDGICHPTKLPDGSLLNLGFRPTKTRYFVVADTQLPRITGVRLEALTHGDLGYEGPGRSRDGVFALSEFSLETASFAATNQLVRATLTNATADFNPPTARLGTYYQDGTTNVRTVGSIAFAIDGDKKTAWGIDAGPGRRNQDRKAVFQLVSNPCHTNGTRFTFWLDFEHGGLSANGEQNNFIGRLRLSVTDSPNPVADPLPKRVREILDIPWAQRTEEQTARVFSYWRTTVPELAAANREADEWMSKYPEGGSSLVFATRNGIDQRVTRVLNRGDWLKPTVPIEPGLPRFLHPSRSPAAASRLAFARWLVDRQSPTTARTLVNRVWQAYFGVGLNPTPEDFGVQTPAPAYQALLDWLACDFMDHGWSLKHLHRRIVSSATYRQSSRSTSALREIDPSNQWLARGPRVRVDGEQVVDIALAASGLLTSKVGGPSTYPPVPDNLAALAFAQMHWPSVTGPERYRRALYAFRRRSVPYPVLQNFDAPNGDASCVRRNRSNTPLQALTTLNETLFFEAAQALASRTLSEAGPDDTSRIHHAFRLCTARTPSARETRELLDLLKTREKHFAEGWVDPRPVAFSDPKAISPSTHGIAPSRLAAWTLVARVILNLDETITKN